MLNSQTHYEAAPGTARGKKRQKQCMDHGATQVEAETIAVDVNLYVHGALSAVARPVRLTSGPKHTKRKHNSSMALAGTPPRLTAEMMSLYGNSLSRAMAYTFTHRHAGRQTCVFSVVQDARVAYLCGHTNVFIGNTQAMPA